MPLPATRVTYIPSVPITPIQKPSTPEELVILQDYSASCQVVFYQDVAAVTSGEAETDGYPAFDS